MSKFCRKLLCLLSLLVVVIGGVIAHFSSMNPTYDLNGDGIIDVCDVQLLIAMISNGSVSRVDFNYDGKVDIKDLQILLNKLGRKVSNSDINEENLYFLSAFMFCGTSRYQIIEKVFQSRLAKVQLICDVLSEEGKLKELVFREHRFPVENVKGSKNLALHISPLSPPMV